MSPEQALLLAGEADDKARAHARTGYHSSHGNEVEFEDGQRVPVLTHDAFLETLFAQMGEPAEAHRDEIIAAGNELAARAIGEFLRWCLPPNTLTERQIPTIAYKLIAAAFVLDPELIRVPMCNDAIAVRLGFEQKEIRKMRGDGTLSEAVKLATDEQKISAASLRQIAKAIGVTAANISPHSAEFSRRFGISNGSQKHDWRKHRPSEHDGPETEADDHHGGCDCEICAERNGDETR